MKKSLFFVLVLISFCSYSQLWKYETGKSDFDGDYKTAYIQGVASDYPYDKPVLSINKFDKNDEINFYISDAGYYPTDTNTSVKCVFDNEPEIIYIAKSFSLSSDGKIIFLSKLKDPNIDLEISKFEFIKKLKEASKVSFRISNNYGYNDLSFSLKGSTKAIDFVLPSVDFDVEVLKVQSKNKVKVEFEKTQKERFDELLEIVEKMKLTPSSFKILKRKIENVLGLGYPGAYDSTRVYSSLRFNLIRKSGSYGYVDIFYVFEDGNEEKITGTWIVSDDSPLLEPEKK